MQADTALQLLPPAAAALRPLLLAATWRLAQLALEQFGEAGVGERFPFLLEHANAFAELDDESEVQAHEPLAALVEAAQWPPHALELWLLLGLVDEDARFAAVFEALDADGATRRPTPALLQAWWGSLPGEGVRPGLRALLDLALIKPCLAGASRSEQTYEVDEACWSALRGEPWARPGPGLRLQEVEQSPPLSSLVLDASTEAWLAMQAEGDLAAGCHLLLRGAEHNGRGSLAAALARAEGRRVLWIAPQPGEVLPAWLGSFCSLAEARPVLRLQATPGEPLRLPPLTGYSGWVAVVCAEEDTLEGIDGLARTLRLCLPDPAQRERIVRRFGSPAQAEDGSALAARLHLSAGHLVRALQRAPDQGDAALREVALAAGSRELERLARRLDLRGAGDESLVLDAALQRDLDALAARCQQRDQLRQALPAGFAARLNAGVRALLAGPSGTGKTLAAQVLARRLGLPLYRLDLGAVVSKYIGETERNLHRLLSAAQALDVMLLLDEGDALLAPRTEVGNANDRYANLETNFLLQRLESHQGLVLVTTNTLGRIDTAFLRRFDLIIHFRPPEPAERLALWRAHLPAVHGVDEASLARIAEACTLAGGQVRNVVLDGVSAALALNRTLDEALLIEALRREYRRSGGLFPLGA